MSIDWANPPHAVRYSVCKPLCWYCGTRIKSLTDGKVYRLIYAQRSQSNMAEGWIRIMNDQNRMSFFSSHHFEPAELTDVTETKKSPMFGIAGLAGEDFKKGELAVFGEDGLLYRKT